MGKQIGFRDSNGGPTELATMVHRRLSACLTWLKLLSGLVLLLIFAVPLVAQTNAPTPDVASGLLEIHHGSICSETGEAKDRSLPKRASASISSTSPAWKLIREDGLDPPTCRQYREQVSLEIFMCGRQRSPADSIGITATVRD
jgi:hypothetical protein